jgi:hypothetical protein
MRIADAVYRNIDKPTNTVNDAEDIAAALRGLGRLPGKRAGSLRGTGMLRLG